MCELQIDLIILNLNSYRILDLGSLNVLLYRTINTAVFYHIHLVKSLFKCSSRFFVSSLSESTESVCYYSDMVNSS